MMHLKSGSVRCMNSFNLYNTPIQQQRNSHISEIPGPRIQSRQFCSATLFLLSCQFLLRPHGLQCCSFLGLGCHCVDTSHLPPGQHPSISQHFANQLTLGSVVTGHFLYPYGVSSDPTYEKRSLGNCPSPLTHFTQCDTLPVLPRYGKRHGFILSCGWVVFHCVLHIPQFLSTHLFQNAH